MDIALFSNQFADTQGHGIARYSRELFAALRADSRNHNITPVAAWSSMRGSRLSRLKDDTGLSLLPSGRRLTPLAWTFLNSPPLEKLIPAQIDVVHAAALGYPISTRKPLVVTIHDLGPLTHPEFFSSKSPWIMKRSLKRAIDQAAKLICVSHSTARELTHLAGNQVARRIEVIHEGVSPAYFDTQKPESIETLDLPLADVPYILSTGKISPRKNIHGVISALAQLARDIPHHLVLVGGDGWNVGEAYDLLKSSGIRDRVHFTGYVSDNQLRTLYRAASAYVHPSFYEGFGLTILEAMASGCPVVTSNVFSLPEVAGDAALLVDPANSQEIAQALKSICGSKTLADELAGKGRLRAAEFSWTSCAEKVMDVYESVVN